MNWSRLLVAVLLLACLGSGKLYAEEQHADRQAAAEQAHDQAPPAASVTLEQIFFAVAAFVLLVLVAILAIAYCLQAQETQQQNEGAASNWSERVLDATTEFNMWNAVGRGDGEALREELKLMELRAIRRQGQR